MIRQIRTRCTGALAALSLAALAACGTMMDDTPPEDRISPETRAMYSAMQDGEHEIKAIPDEYISDARARQMVDYYAPLPEGSIVVDPGARYLYHVQEGDRAMRYLVAVGAEGFGFAGEATIPFQRDWPRWTPTKNMLRRDPETYEPVKNGLPGGGDNPLGARALYLYKGGRDTLYRIHGTPSPWTVGHPTSSGCIRLFDQDIVHLAEQVEKGTKVVVLTRGEAGKWTAPEGEAPEVSADEEEEGGSET